MIKRIYRIEDRKGIGPFNSEIKGAQEIVGPKKYDHMTYPEPIEDPEINRDPEENELCGCISMEQIVHWFSKKEIKKLEEFGFFLIEIQIEDSYITYGIAQILFQKSHVIKRKNIQTKFSN